MEYENSGVVEQVTMKSGFQSIQFKNSKESFSNWLNPGKPNEHKSLSKGDIIDYNFEKKGFYRNLTEFRIVTSTTPKLPASPEPDFDKADTVNEKEINEIKSKIKEITVRRGQTLTFKQYESTKFEIGMTAEYNPDDNPEKVCAILTNIVENELNRQIINGTEKRKENGP